MELQKIIANVTGIYCEKNLLECGMTQFRRVAGFIRKLSQ